MTEQSLIFLAGVYVQVLDRVALTVENSHEGIVNIADGVP